MPYRYFPGISPALLIGDEGTERIAVRNEDLTDTAFLRKLAAVNCGKPGLGDSVIIVPIEEVDNNG